MQKPSNPQGTRDFGPEVMRKRNIILDTIKGVFKKYAFEPLETPAIENLSMLTGKYGDEGDKLLYKIRSNREIVHEIDEEKAQKINELFPCESQFNRMTMGFYIILTKCQFFISSHFYLLFY